MFSYPGAASLHLPLHVGEPHLQEAAGVSVMITALRVLLYSYKILYRTQKLL